MLYINKAFIIIIIIIFRHLGTRTKEREISAVGANIY